MNRYLAGTAVLIATMTMTACGTSGHAAQPASELSVHVGIFGGPLGVDGKMAASNAPGADAPIRVTGSGGHTWTSTTGADGIARFTLQPGRYTVTSTECGREPQHVTVQAGHTSHVQIQCDVP